MVHAIAISATYTKHRKAGNTGSTPVSATKSFLNQCVADACAKAGIPIEIIPLPRQVRGTVPSHGERRLEAGDDFDTTFRIVRELGLDLSQAAIYE